MLAGTPPVLIDTVDGHRPCASRSAMRPVQRSCRSQGTASWREPTQTESPRSTLHGAIDSWVMMGCGDGHAASVSERGTCDGAGVSAS